MTVFRSFSLLTLLLLAPLAQGGNGAENLAYDAVSQSLAGAGAASGYSAAWLIINPAGITRLQGRADFAFDYFSAEAKLSPKGLLGNWPQGPLRTHSDIYGGAVGVVLQLEGITFGAGAFPYGGYVLEYRHPVRLLPWLLLGQSDRQNRYQHARVPIGLAKSFDDGWSVGATLDLDVKRIRTDHITLGFRETSGANSWDESFGGGITLGVQKHWEKVSLGVSYASRHWMSRFAEYEDLLGSSLDAPQQVQAGIALRLGARYELLLDYKWIDWSGVRMFGREPLDGGMGWKDQHLAKLAVVYSATPRMIFRVGISHGKSPVDENHLFVGALAPVLFETHVAGGFSYRISQKTELHGALVALLPTALNENGGGDILGWAGAGTRSELRAASVHLGFTRHF